MTIYYLYVKTHNITGLKYLGQTKKKDPHMYKGSGKYWLLHLKKHGKDYTTEILCECKSKEELKEKGLYYSQLLNVVESREWANLIEETGGGAGGKKGIPRSEETKDKIRQNKPDQSGIKNGMFGKTHTASAKEKCGLSNKGKDIKSIEGKKSISNHMKSKWNDEEYRNKHISMLKNRKGEKRSTDAIESYKKAAALRNEKMTPEERSARTLAGIATKKIKYAGLKRKRVIDNSGKISYIWVK